MLQFLFCFPDFTTFHQNEYNFSNLDQILIKVPRHLSDYKEVFEAMGSLSELSNHQLKQLMDACIQSGSPFPSKKVRERLEMLDLNFANGQTVMKNGLTAFNLTIPYFVDPVSNMVSIAPNSTSTSSLQPVTVSFLYNCF